MQISSKLESRFLRSQGLCMYHAPAGPVVYKTAEAALWTIFAGMPNTPLPITGAGPPYLNFCTLGYMCSGVRKATYSDYPVSMHNLRIALQSSLLRQSMVFQSIDSPTAYSTHTAPSLEHTSVTTN